MADRPGRTATMLVRDMPEYAVVDTWVIDDDGRVPILARFNSEYEASAFIDMLPNHLEGRYGLDGPLEATAPVRVWQSGIKLPISLARAVFTSPKVERID